MTQNKIILFCYAFIIGIGLSMRHPLDARWLMPLWFIAIAAFLLLPLLLATRGLTARGTTAGNKTILAALALAGLLLGYVRYLDQLRIPDRHLGHIEVGTDTFLWRETRPLDTTAFPAIRVLEETGESPVTLQITGHLHAWFPDKDSQGAPRLDPDARWSLNEVRVPQQATVVIPPRTPPGTLISLNEPFSIIDEVHRVDGVGPARLALLRKPNRVAELTRPGRHNVPVTILGRITQDPWVYTFQTILTITPDLIQYQPDGPFLRIEQGRIRVTLDPGMPGYRTFARTSAYGNDVWIRGELQTPPAAANPGMFSQRQYLLSQHVEGQMSLRPSREGTTHIEALRPEGGNYRTGNPLVAFSLGLRDDLLRVIKQTMPHPNSAFLGAVSLGLRYGMHDTETLLSEQHADSPVPPLVRPMEGRNERISHEFRAAGINHVLAVSGLHVTIITAMFIGIFSLLRISKRAYVPAVILILIIFAIITGARPSTMRAVIMNSLFLITWGYLHQTLRTSVLLGVPVAALVILAQNPAMLIDPSFTLSFGAILSLALLTQPAYDVLRRFRGNNLLALFITLATATAAMIHNWFLVTAPAFWLLFAPCTAALFLLARLLTRRGIKLIKDFAFDDIPQGIAVFLAAQIGIQLGMMIPLSAFYFHRWASAGAYANLIAIPLIGVILQLGMLGGIIGLIPGIGLYIALLLNAANWICSSFFILLGHYSARWFPFAFVRKQSLLGLAAYYAILATLVWHKPLFGFLRTRISALPGTARKALLWTSPALLLALLAAAIATGPLAARRATPTLQISILAVNYGSALLIETPAGRNILIDTGFVQQDRGRRNEAERTILPYLSTRRINKLDALILTAPANERILGAAHILEHARVERLITPAMLTTDRLPPDLQHMIQRRSPTFLNRLAGSTLTHHTVKLPQPLFEENINGTPFRIEAIAPDAETLRDHPLALRIRHGQFSMLIPSDMTWQQQQHLLENTPPHQLATSVLIAPARGVDKDAMMQQEHTLTDSISWRLFETIQPDYVVFEFGNPRPVLGAYGREAIASHNRTRRIAEDILGPEHVMITDRDGAVLIESDGTQWTLYTQADRIDGAEDTVTDMELGL